MQLILETQAGEHAAVIRCQGRIVSGDEVRALELECEKLRKLNKKRIVLQLAEVGYIDSAGLGALIRLFGVLRADSGGLRLCQVSPVVLKVLQVTNLHAVLPISATEREALEAFSAWREPSDKSSRTPRPTIVCIDSSADLLAYLNALLTQAGYEVFTTRHLPDARVLINAMRPALVLYGTGSEMNDSAIEKIRQSVPQAQILPLPSDFSSAEASQAGSELVSRVQSILGGRP
jgi:anti-sigma B factor antagonist